VNSNRPRGYWAFPVFTRIAVLLFCCFSASIAAQDDSLNVVKERGTLIVGVDIPYGVMEFLDQSGKPTGIDIDIAQQIAQRLGTEIKFSSIPFAKLFVALNDNKVDLLVSAVTITPERQESMSFSSPYMDVGLSIAVAEGTTTIQSADDLSGKK